MFPFDDVIMLFLKISGSLEAAKSGIKMGVSLEKMTGASAEAPVKFPSDRINQNLSLAGSRFSVMLR